MGLDFKKFLKFNPPFGSHMRESYDYSKYTVYDFPTEDLKIQETNRFYKDYMAKKSIRHSHEIYEKFREYFGEGMTLHVDSLSKYIFTNETVSYFKINLETGGIQARKIKDLPKKNKHAKFFTKDIEVISTQ
jgi:hypothetical protein